ncbi:MAG: hypothetical protein M3P10_06180 [Actinomycetota bacterium]|nr:hypothetical protein [Actinomycetota bacterium]
MGVAGLVVGGILPVYRYSGRFVYRLAWGLDVIPLSQHVVQGSRWALTLGLPFLALLAFARASRFAAGLLLATVIVASVASVDWAVSLLSTGGRGSETEAGAYLTLVGSVLVTVGALGLLVGERSLGPDPAEVELPGSSEPG